MGKVYIILFKFSTPSIKFIFKLLPFNITYNIILISYILNLY